MLIKNRCTQNYKTQYAKYHCISKFSEYIVCYVGSTLSTIDTQTSQIIPKTVASFRITGRSSTF